jgi:hypothetical protein
MNIDPVSAALLGTLIGAVAGIAGTVAVAIITMGSEQKKHLRQLAFEAGIKTWTLHNEIAKKASETGRKVGVDPLEAYVLHAFVFSRIIEEGDLDRETVLKKWKEVSSIAEAVHAEIKRNEKLNKASQAGEGKPAI